MALAKNADDPFKAFWIDGLVFRKISILKKNSVNQGGAVVVRRTITFGVPSSKPCNASFFCLTSGYNQFDFQVQAEPLMFIKQDKKLALQVFELGTPNVVQR